MADKLLKYDVAMKSTKTVWQMETPRCYTGDENTVTFDFNITDLEAADLVGVIPNVYLYMRDGSFFQNGPADGVEITGAIVNYTMKGNEGKHSGIARAQLVLVWDDEINPPEKLTSQLYDFEVVSGLENKVAVEVMIQDWTTLTREARTFIDTSSDEVDALKGELQTAINTANASLGEFDVALETGIVAANLAEKLEDFEEINNSRLLSTERQLAETATKAELSGVASPLTASLVAQMTDTTRIYVYAGAEGGYTAGNWYYHNGTAWTSGGVYQATGIADSSITSAKLGTTAYDAINREIEEYVLLEQKQLQEINKFVGNKNGSRSLTSDTVDGCTISFINADATSPYPISKVSKVNKLTYTSKTTYFWYKKHAIADVNAPEVCGFWVKKADLLAMANFNRLVWFHDGAGVSVKLLSTTFISSNIVAGFTQTQTFPDVGVTATFACKLEKNGWLYIVQTIDKKPATATTVGMGIYAVNPTAVTGKTEFVGITQLEGQTEIVPYLIYPETVAEKGLTSTEVSAAINGFIAPARETKDFGYNLETTLRKYRASLGKRDTRVLKIACVGDSITEGFWSGLNYERAYPVQLRKLMQARYGGQDEGFVTAHEATRWIATGTWATAKKGMALCQKSSSTSGDYIEFTFTGVALDLIYSKFTDGGSCVVEIDGVVKTALNCYGATEIYAQSQSYTGLTSGPHTLRVYAPTDGKKVYVEGAYVKTVGDTGGVRVDRRALSGSAAVEWSYPQLVKDTFVTQPADLFVLALGINDCGAGRTPTELKGYLQTLITAMKAVGDVLLIPMMQASSTDARFANWSNYVQVYYELADSNNIGLIDIYKLYGDYATAQSYGLFGIENGDGEGVDTIHPSARGHQMIADTLFKLIG